MMKCQHLLCKRYELNTEPPLHKSATSIVLLAIDHGPENDDSVSSLSSVGANDDGKPQVAIKLTWNKAQYEREVYFIGSKKFDDRYVVGIQEGSPSGLEMESAIQSLDLPFSNYKYGFVMNAGDRSLEAVLRSESPDLETIRNMTMQIAKSIEHIHTGNVPVMHGGIKMRNVVRMDEVMKLIDFDASCEFHDPKTVSNSSSVENKQLQYVGCKFSSAILPPQMFYRLKNDQELNSYNTYWQNEKDSNSDRWKQIKPLTYFNGHDHFTIVIKTFDENRNSPEELSKLPYKPESPSSKIDVWSFGILLYHEISGVPFYSGNRDDNIIDPYVMYEAKTITRKEIIRKIRNHIDNEEAVCLLVKILRVKPKNRPSMEVILKHRFFNKKNNSHHHHLPKSSISSHGISSVEKQLIPKSLILSSKDTFYDDKIDKSSRDPYHDDEDKKIDEILRLMKAMDQRTKQIHEQTIVIADMSLKLYKQIRTSEKLMLKAMFEATEVKVPTCFIILNHKLTNDNQEPPNSDQLQMLNGMNKISRIFDQISSIVNVKETMNRIVDDMLTGKEYWFYLVDEITMQPVFGDGYPIRITTPKTFIPKVLPLLRVGLKAMAAVNTVAGMGRCFGFSTPTIPDDIMANAELGLGALNQESSVAEFKTLQDCLTTMIDKENDDDDDDDKDDDDEGRAEEGGTKNNRSSGIKTLRGPALRELERFYDAHSASFCGLSRVCVRGMACWTLKGEQIQESALEDDSPPATGGGGGSPSTHNSLPSAYAVNPPPVIVADFSLSPWLSEEGLEGRHIFIEGFGHKRGFVLRYEKSSVLQLCEYSLHVIRFDGDPPGTETKVVLHHKSKGQYVGNRYVVLNS